MRKKILTLLLCCALVSGLVPTVNISAYALEPEQEQALLVCQNGEAVTEAELPISQKITLQADVYPEDFAAQGYQWQIQVPGGIWVDIAGEAQKSINLTYGMVASLLDSSNAVQIRCKLTDDRVGAMLSNEVRVTVDDSRPIPELPLENGTVLREAEAVETPAPAAPAQEEVSTPTQDETPADTNAEAPAQDQAQPADSEPAAADPVDNAADADAASPAPADNLNNTGAGLDNSPADVIGNLPAPIPALEQVKNTLQENAAAFADENGEPTGETGENEKDTYSIIINYVFADGSQAANPWTATVAKGSAYAQTVNSPVVVGYEPDKKSVEVNVTNIQADRTYAVIYSPAEVEFTVKHYQQNVDNDNYTLVETETKKGYTESLVSDKLAKTYEGFYALLYDVTTTVAADGSTEVEIYYDRNYYLMNFDLDGGYGVEPIYARYGSTIEVGTPIKAGYEFVGWNPTIPSTMPAEPENAYKAEWKPAQATYLIQYWQENANDSDYSYESSVQKTGEVRTFVSGSNDKSYAGFKFDHADENVTINGDGSTVVNVYYKRIVYEVKFYTKNGRSWKEDASKRITAKYGAFIGDKWPGDGWYVDEDQTVAQSYLAIMPLDGKVFYGQQTGRNTATATYYVEALPGESYDTQIGGRNYKVHHKDTAKYNRGLFGKGLTVTDEERYDIEGFACNKTIGTQNDEDYNGAKFYYTRKSFDLVFDNQYGEKITENMLFEQKLSASENYIAGYTPKYPEKFEEGAYTFGGWYADPGCTVNVDWNSKMPAQKVVLYAKWIPKTHVVRTFLTQKELDADTPMHTWSSVPHGTVIAESDRPTDLENGKYTFIGWFYRDRNGAEKAFDFSMPVNRDLDLYAKWSSNTLVEYTITYTLEDGTVIAAETKGSALAGTTKTFEAKTGTALNADYQIGYFPMTNSHSLTMNIEGKNEFTFIYVPKEKVKYTVRYLEKGTNKVLYQEKQAETSNAVITEKFEQIKGYAPDAYQKRLVLSVDEATNVITFWYVKDDEHAPVQIIHWTQNIAGDGYTEYQSSTNLNGEIGKEYTESALDIPGFTYNEAKSNASGTLTAEGLVLNLYYDRIEYPYAFCFVERDTNVILADAVTGTARYQAQVTQAALDIPGYTLVSAQNQAINIAIEDPAGTAKNNVKIFYYTEKTVDIKYQVVGPTGCGTLSSYQDNSVKVKTGTVQGSAPTAAKGFRFVGWYKDEACMKAVDPSWIDSDKKLTPQQEDGMYQAAVYYAKFERALADLTITKSGWQPIDENQSFIFHIQGTDENTSGIDLKVVVHGDGSVTLKDLPVGNYTVTEETGWSWRYTPDKMSKNIDLQSNGTLPFSNSRTNGNWLNGNAFCDNRWMNNTKHESN